MGAAHHFMYKKSLRVGARGRASGYASESHRAGASNLPAERESVALVLLPEIASSEYRYTCLRENRGSLGRRIRSVCHGESGQCCL